LFLIDHVGDPDESLFMGMFFQVSIKHVISDIDFSIGIPTSKLWFLTIEYFVRKFKPTDFGCVLFPIGLPFSLGVCPLTARFINIFFLVFHILGDLDLMHSYKK
jgi:hypothetical protein